MDRIIMAHGGGGALSNDLIARVLVPALGGEWRGPEDAAAVPAKPALRMTTDSFVVKPLRFPGGDIGSLAVHGSVNDLAVAGCRPLALALAWIVQEGFAIEELAALTASAGRAARAVGVPAIAGDTKVVARGDADGLFVTACGLGEAVCQADPAAVLPGDAVVINGCIGDHGIAVLSAREGVGFQTPVVSDSQSVWPLVEAVLAAGVDIHAMRDPTRGGVAAACNEIATASAVSIVLEEAAVPVRPAVHGACDMLGLDPLTIANEGEVIMFVPSADAPRAVAAMRERPEGRDAAVIGRVAAARHCPVYLATSYGSERIVEMPRGEALPRIC